MTITPPTALTSRRFIGGSASPVYGNLAWNDDGQVSYICTRGVKILTPYLISSLPAPQVESHTDDDPDQILNSSHRPNREVRDAFANAQAGSSSSAPKVRRPKGGDVQWFLNNVHQGEVDREGRYGWSGVGDESNQAVTVDSADTKAAEWSPSGLADSGGCMMAILSTRGQVSIYAPTKDPSSTRWEEVFDITLATRQLSTRSPAATLTIGTVFEMRSTAISWSKQTDMPLAAGYDSSLLAIGDRAGQVSFWEYGPKRRFTRLAVRASSRHWVTKLSWSKWTTKDQDNASAVLAVGFADGSVSTLRVDRACKLDKYGRLSMSLEVKDPRYLPDTDKRSISVLKWVDDTLIIARSGTVTLYRDTSEAVSTSGPAWSGVRRLLLPQMGNWAGANPYGDCVGVSRTSTGDLLLVLSGHLYYIITNLDTSPTVSATADALTLSIYSRRIFMDPGDIPCLTKGNGMDPKGRMMTARTAGWGNVGEAGLVGFYGEMFCNHDLSSTTDAKKSHYMHVADMGGLVPGRIAIGDELEMILDDPPILSSNSPLKVLLPTMMRIVVALDPVGVAAEVGDVLSADQQDTSDLLGDGDGEKEDRADLRWLLWVGRTQRLNAARLRYSFARFCDARLGQASSEASSSTAPPPPFAAIAESSLAYVRKTIDRALAEWMSSLDLEGIQGDDMRFASHVAKAHPTAMLTAMLDAAHAAERDLGSGGSVTDRCPACGSVIEDDGGEIGRCAKGHEWNRCTVTGYLLLNASYRICSCCGAASLLPTCHKDPTKAVMQKSGREQDYLRFERSSYAIKGLDRPGKQKGTGEGRGEGQEGWLMDEALEAAVSCILCGGRWVRAM